MGNDIELLSVGDATYDVFITPTESETMCKLEDKESLICFSYGDKIPVKSLNFSIGGNAANNSIGTARLGVKVAIVVTLGEDEISNQIQNQLKQENVRNDFLSFQKGGKSNYSIVVNYSGERTIFVYHAPRIYELPQNLPVTPWIYLTSMGENFEDFYNKIFEFLQKNPNTKLGFNPGSWQLRQNIDVTKKILSVTHILFVNREEGERLTDIKNSKGNEKELLKGLANLGSKIICITDGPNGCFIFNSIENKFLRSGILPVEVTQRTGAGDAFGSGCLAALIKNKKLEEAILWGTVNSASVIGFTGSQKGLLHDQEIPIWLEKCKNANLKVEEF